MRLPTTVPTATRHNTARCPALRRFATFAATAAVGTVVCLPIQDAHAAPGADGMPGGEPFVELRLYPTGQIVGLGWRQMLAPQDRLSAAVLYNRVRRGNNGRHDDERGDGLGAGLGWDHFLAGGQGVGLGWSLGARADAFALRIDYRDATAAGRSRVTVLQPTATAGYSFAGFDSGWRIGLSAGLGTEINVSTAGTKVGQGAIALLGLSVSLR